MTKLQKYGGIVAVIAIVIAIIGIFTGGNTVIQRTIEQISGLPNDTGYNSIQFQQLGSAENYLSIGAAKLSLGTDTTNSSVSSTTIRNNTGKTLLVWANFLAKTASSTMIYALATSSDANNASNGGAFTTMTNSVFKIKVATSSSESTGAAEVWSSMQMATSTKYNQGPFVWRDGEYFIFQRVADKNTCAGGQSGTVVHNSCESATTTVVGGTAAEVHLFYSQ